MLTSQEKRQEKAMNAHFARDIVDYRHAELMARVEQSRRYHLAREARLASATGVPAPTPRIGAVRRPFAAVHSWLVAGVL
jgi:hypothetical protein